MKNWLIITTLIFTFAAASLSSESNEPIEKKNAL